MRRSLSGPLLAAAALLVAVAEAPSAHAAFPGRNGRIAYVELGQSTTHDTDTSISTVRPDGSRRREFFNVGNPPRPGCDFTICPTDGPAFSPGGGRLLAHGNADRGTIWIVPATNPRRARALNKGRSFVDGFDASWLPDGHAVVYNDLSHVIRRLRANRTRALRPGNDPQWSRKGRVAMVRDEDNMGGSNAIYTMSPTGRRVRRLASGTGPDWSPHGHWLVYATPGGSIDMARGAERRRLFVRRPGISACDPAFSPDGRWIVFSGGNGFADCTRSDDEKGPLYVQRLDGSGLRAITPDSAGGASWQPVLRG